MRRPVLAAASAVVMVAVLLGGQPRGVAAAGALSLHAQVVSADFGDAPDDTNDPGMEAYPGVAGKFPSLLNTANASAPGNTGPYHLAVDEEWLAGRTIAPSSTTVEGDATLVDQDEDDARLLIFCEPAGPALTCNLEIEAIHVAPGAPDTPRYINVLIDQNRDGTWGQSEYVIQDRAMHVPPGDHHSLQSNEFTLATLAPVWVRVTLTRSPLNTQDWDGAVPPGGLGFGETEDQLVTPFLPGDPPRVKEPLRNFRFWFVPNPVWVRAGPGGAPFFLVIERVRAPVPDFHIRATDIKLLSLDNCLRISGSGGGVNIPAPADHAGGIVNRGDKIKSEAPHYTPPVLGPPAVETKIAFTAFFPKPPDQRWDRCWATFAVDPDGEIVEYDLELEVDFKEPTVGGVAQDLPEVAGAPLEAPGSSGGDGGVLIGLIAGVVAGVVALGGAGWYARRRWLR